MNWRSLSKTSRREWIWLRRYLYLCLSLALAISVWHYVNSGLFAYHFGLRSWTIPNTNTTFRDPNWIYNEVTAERSLLHLSDPDDGLTATIGLPQEVILNAPESLIPINERKRVLEYGADRSHGQDISTLVLLDELPARFVILVFFHDLDLAALLDCEDPNDMAELVRVLRSSLSGEAPNAGA